MICYTQESELQMQSYDAMKNAKKHSRSGDLVKSASLSKLHCMLVLVTTKITKINGIHPCKDGMAFFKTHVELRIISCTH